MGSNHEKNWRPKISWHTPFKQKFDGLVVFWNVIYDMGHTNEKLYKNTFSSDICDMSVQ